MCRSRSSSRQEAGITWTRQTQCSLSEGSSDSEKLGFGAVVGDEVWNQQSSVRIILGPLSLERYRDFLPDGSCWEPLRAWVRFFSNDEFDFEVKLVLEREKVPACELGAEDAVPAHNSGGYHG